MTTVHHHVTTVEFTITVTMSMTVAMSIAATVMTATAMVMMVAEVAAWEIRMCNFLGSDRCCSV